MDNNGVTLTAALTTLATFALFALPPASNLATTATVIVADRVERTIFAQGVVPRLFYFSFGSLYQVDGQQVTPAHFWRVPLAGRVIQVKADRKVGYWFVRRVNVLSGAE